MQSSLSQFVVGAGLVGYMLSIGLNARIARLIHVSGGLEPAKPPCLQAVKMRPLDAKHSKLAAGCQWNSGPLTPLFWFFCFEAAKTCLLVPLFWEGHMHAYQWALWPFRPIESAFLVIVGLHLGKEEIWSSRQTQRALSGAPKTTLGIQRFLNYSVESRSWSASSQTLIGKSPSCSHIPISISVWAFVASQWFLLAQNQEWSAYVLLDIDHAVRLAFAISMILLAVWRGNRWACGFAVAIVFEQASMLAGGFYGCPQMVPVFSWLAAQVVWLTKMRREA